MHIQAIMSIRPIENTQVKQIEQRFNESYLAYCHSQAVEHFPINSLRNTFPFARSEETSHYTLHNWNPLTTLIGEREKFTGKLHLNILLSKYKLWKHSIACSFQTFPTRVGSSFQSTIWTKLFPIAAPRVHLQLTIKVLPSISRALSSPLKYVAISKHQVHKHTQNYFHRINQKTISRWFPNSRHKQPRKLLHTGWCVPKHWT